MASVEKFVHSLSTNLGAPEVAIRFLLSLYIGYPLALLYRSVVLGKSASIQHIFFTLCGLSICYFNYGFDIIHSIINIAVIYVLLLICPATKFSILFAFIFNTLYLVIGYYVNTKIALTWTTPQCVICLRLTAIVVDVYDGKKREEKITPEQKESALTRVPSLLEICGQSYYFGTFLAGPQFSMKRYLQFVNGEFIDPLHSGPPRSIGPGLRRLCFGTLYIGIHQCGSMVFSQEHLVSDEFMNHYFITRCAFVLVWGRILFNQYVGCWMITEGVCMLTGLSYNGKDENGNILWDGILNIKLYSLETASSFHGMIASFNHNTNLWMSKYIFKRLRFLGSKLVSQSITLFYLALWHGIKSGYYMNFFLEFFMVNTENQLIALSERFSILKKLNSTPSLQPLLWVLKKTLITFSLSYALLSFGLLDWNIYMKVYGSIYYIGHFIFLLFPMVIYFFASVPMSVYKSHSKVSSNKEKIN